MWFEGAGSVALSIGLREEHQPATHQNLLAKGLDLIVFLKQQHDNRCMALRYKDIKRYTLRYGLKIFDIVRALSRPTHK